MHYVYTTNIIFDHIKTDEIVMDKFNNKYRIPSARLQYWDYAAMGAYFITICTKHKIHFFGNITNGAMQLTPLGSIVQQEWLKTFELRTDMALTMGAFVVMPNHFHAIVIIGANAYNTGDGGGWDATRCRDAMRGNSTKTGDTDAMHGVSAFAPQSKNLASLVRRFKSAVTTHARKMGDSDFNWQPRYHDHIIRDTASFDTIQQYIVNNPAKWDADTFNVHLL